MRQHEKLRMYWSKKENDLMFWSPEGFFTTAAARYLDSIFTKEVLKELESRGYDITTLKFSIEPKQGDLRFASTRPAGITSQQAWDILRQTNEENWGTASKEAAGTF